MIRSVMTRSNQWKWNYVLIHVFLDLQKYWFDIAQHCCLTSVSLLGVVSRAAVSRDLCAMIFISAYVSIIGKGAVFGMFYWSCTSSKLNTTLTGEPIVLLIAVSVAVNHSRDSAGQPWDSKHERPDAAVHRDHPANPGATLTVQAQLECTRMFIMHVLI